MGRFATAINCMDGRVQLPVIEYIKKNYDIDFVDTITLPGPVKVLSENKDNILIEHIKKCVEISIRKHNSNLLAIVAHYDCAGNPVDKDTQISHILSAVEEVWSWFHKIKIIGLWVDENWSVNLIKEL